MLFLIRIVQSICSNCDILALYGSPSYVPVKMQDVFQISLFRPVRALILEIRKQGSHWTKQQDIRNFLPFDRRGGVCSWDVHLRLLKYCTAQSKPTLRSMYTLLGLFFLFSHLALSVSRVSFAHKLETVMCRVLKRSQFGKVDWQE